MNAFTFENPNILQTDEQCVPVQPAAVSIRCPHCRQLGVFFALLAQGYQYSKATTGQRVAPIQIAIRTCPNATCNGLVLALSSGARVLQVLPPERLDFDGSGLPQRCLDTLHEAVACHAAGAWRAAAMMVRRLLEELCEENNATGPNLHKRLEALRSKITLPEVLFAAMGELKALGNDAAHVEAKDYDKIGREEATLSIELAKEIVKALYQLQGLVGRLQSLKNNP